MDTYTNDSITKYWVYMEDCTYEQYKYIKWLHDTLRVYRNMYANNK